MKRLNLVFVDADIDLIQSLSDKQTLRMLTDTENSMLAEILLSAVRNDAQEHLHQMIKHAAESAGASA